MNENSNIFRIRQQSKIDDPQTNVLQSGDIYPNSLIPLFGRLRHNTAQVHPHIGASRQPLYLRGCSAPPPILTSWDPISSRTALNARRAGNAALSYVGAPGWQEFCTMVACSHMSVSLW
jgi:hypothetical protein